MGGYARGDARRVLVLHSYNQGYAWTDSIHQSIAEELGGDGIELSVEYMDTKRHQGDAWSQELERHYAIKYGRMPRKIDCILSTDDAALNFLISYRDSLFPGVPVVFCGANSFDRSRLEGLGGFTGVNEHISIAGTVEAALAMRPKARKLVVLNGATLTGRLNAALFRQMAGRYGAGREIIYLDSPEEEELVRALAPLSAQDIVLYLSYLRTASGKTFSVPRSVQIVSQASPAPVFGCWDFLIGHGVVGGKVVSGRGQGMAAARMVREILAGRSADSIPVMMDSPNEHIYDYTQIKRFGISTRALPAKARIVNVPPAFWRDYWPWFAGGAALIVIEALLIGRLLIAGAMRRRAEESLRQSEAKWRAYIDKAPLGVFVADRDGRYVDVNPTACRNTGYTREELLNMHLSEIMAPEASEEARRHFALVVEEGYADGEVIHLRKDGSRAWTQVVAVRLSDKRFLAFCQDVTRRRTDERLLRVQRDLAIALTEPGGMERILALCTHAAMELGHMDAGGVYTLDSESQVLELAHAEGLSPAFLEPHSRFESDSPQVQTVLPGRPVYACYADFHTPEEVAAQGDGLRAIAIVPMRHHDRVIGCLTLGSRTMDEVPIESREALETLAAQIAQAIAQEEAVRARESSERDYRAIVSALPDFLFRIDRDMRIVDYHAPDKERLLLPPEEFLGRKMKEVLPAGLVEKTREYLERTLTTMQPQLYEYDLEVEGETCAYETRMVPCGASEVLAIVREVTEARRAQEALSESEARYRTLFERAPVGIFTTRIDGSVVAINPTMARILAFESPEDALAYYTNLGEQLYVEAERREEFVRCMQTDGVVEEFEYEAVRHDGKRIWLSMNARVAVSDERGAVIEGFTTDITERLRGQEERLKLERQIQQTQKLESLGVLAGGIAHDFNNLLMAILGHAELALEDLTPVSPVRHNIKEIETASRRAADLCRQMLAYSGKGRFLIEKFQLSSLVEEMTHLLKTSISKKVVLNLQADREIPVVEGDPTQIRQVLMNLVINASEAIGERSGVITVRTGAAYCTQDDFREAYLEEELPEGLYVFVEVADTGCGMDEETLARLFEPFFTTKFTGRGLGMSAVLGIVRGHRGILKVDTQEGRGTVFRILLPAADGAAQPAAQPAKARSWKHGGVVLLVDDEETIRALGRRMLERMGLEVITADDGRQALERYEENADRIGLVLLDLMMPHMDGEQALREIKARHPDAPIVMASGYSEHEIGRRFEGLGILGVLQKPYSISALREHVAAVFGPADGAA